MELIIVIVIGLMIYEDVVQVVMYWVVDKGLLIMLIDKVGCNWSIEGYIWMVVNMIVNWVFNEVCL